MIINKASKCRLYPNREQQKIINQTLGSCRYIYNKMLERQMKLYKRRGEHLSYNEMQNLLPGMKKYLPWLKEADSQALKYACRQLDAAYRKFFKGEGGFPKFKRRRDRQRYTTTNSTSIRISSDRKKVKLPIVGWIKLCGLKMPDYADIKRATISRDTDGKYYVSISYAYETYDIYRMPEKPKAIGIDFREGDLYCDSNGISAGKPNDIMHSMDKLKHAQNKLSAMIESHITGYKNIGNKRYPVYDRKLSEYKNIQKQRRRIAKIHKHIANQRKDFLQKHSTAIAKQYDVICIEDFRAQDMLIKKDEDPSAVKRHNINRKVYDDGWYMFTQMLEYKTAHAGKALIRVGEIYPSTQTCSCCGHVEQSVTDLTVRKWQCPKCGTEHDRDYNSAVNIKNEGLRLFYAT